MDVPVWKWRQRRFAQPAELQAILLSWRFCNLNLKAGNQLSTALTKGQRLLLIPWWTTNTFRLAFASRSDAMGPLLHSPGKQVSGKGRLDTRKELSVAVSWQFTLLLYLSWNHQNLWDYSEILFGLEYSEGQATISLAAKLFQNIPVPRASFLWRINVYLDVYSLFRLSVIAQVCWQSSLLLIKNETWSILQMHIFFSQINKNTSLFHLLLCRITENKPSHDF